MRSCFELLKTMGRKSDRNTWALAHSLSSNATNQLNVFGLESDAFVVGGTQIGVLQTVDQVMFSGFLKRKQMSQ